MIKFVFFDRDGTLTKNSEKWAQLRRDKFLEWSGKSLDESDEFFTKHFQKVLHGGYPFVPYKTVDQELLFFRQWFLSVFEEYGITEQTEERADFLTEQLWYLRKELYPETLEVLNYFKEHGYRMGVIGDCPPSLELSLEQCGIHGYFEVFAASSLVGIGKPNKGIFDWAIKQANVKMEECLYVDDCQEEAVAASNYGMKSFWLDRSKEHSGEWIVHDLLKLIEYEKKVHKE
jgi:putative hydrolase of the HAD superfamily